MPIGEICNREVVVAWRNDTALEASRLMRQHHVGNVLVVDDHNGVQIPVGIVTDRDLIMEIMAPELDGATITLGDIMSRELVTVKESTGVFEAIQYMRQKAVRRLPIVDESGGLVGILTLDDLLELLSEEFHEIAKLVRNEQQKESRSRR
ncbi:MAG: CBS domain-containing protein [Candidatus Nitrotoga sp.]|nr:CBS domain-containing protein [Candidatus Nitrotoga sp.]MDP1854706.1 CBS domain-containing protein [Candidatus Nitrotoga sp.]